jgi:mutator protein MutT
MADIYKAGGIIIKDKKLLTVRSVGTKFFIDPGGKIEAGETAEQAVIRELKEEISIDVSPADLEPFGDFTAEAANHPGKQVHMQVFMVKKWQGEIKAASEIEELCWLSSATPDDVLVGSIYRHEVLPRLQARGLVD